MAIIKTLKDFLTKATLYPITKTQAVYDDTVGRLDSYLQNTLGAEPIDDVEESTDLRDADTLGGRYTAEDLDAMPKSTAIEDYANIEPPIIDADRLGGKYTAKDIDKMKQDIIDIYVGDDGKLHKVQGGADSVLPFNSGGFKLYSGTGNVDIILSNLQKDDYVLVSHYFESLSSTFGSPYISCDNGEIIESHYNYRVDNVPYQITGLTIIKALNDGDLTIKSNHTIHATTTWEAFVSISSNYEQ